MKRITKDMVKAGGHRYCCECVGPRVKAHWTHKGRDYCDVHKPIVPVATDRPYEHAKVAA